MPFVNPLKERQRGWIDHTIAEIEYVVGKQKAMNAPYSCSNRTNITISMVAQGHLGK